MGGCGKEWIGEPEPDDDEALAISSVTLLDDLDTKRDNDPPPPERRMIYRFGDWSRNFGFWTAIFSEIGLLPLDTGPRYRC